MKIVAALTDPVHASLAQEQGADIVELRFDLMAGDPVNLVQTCKERCSLPVIATIRSAQEGGQFFGDAKEWFEKIEPIVPLVDYIDIEQRFASYAPQIKEAVKNIIASHHTGEMISLHDLFMLERELRTYGDMIKIIVTPGDEEDIIDLISFTHTIQKPLITGVMGTKFRYARAILPLFGSQFVYCSAGTATADGQYSITDFIRLMGLMKGSP
jgi:3-dehydroquinate dehydratase-1